MKFIKIYLVVVTIFLVIALGLGIYVWYTVQKLNGTVGVEGNTEENRSATSTESESSSSREPIVIQTSTLPEAQQNILENLGFEGGSVTITANMIVCAEGVLGKKRLDELVNGASPTPLESMRLLPCLKP